MNNARTHSPEQITKLRSSLREFGFVNPVLIDREFNVLAGHGRLAAAKEEGIKEVPCVFVEHLSEAQKKAYILADNKLALDAGWDDSLLKVEMESLQMKWRLLTCLKPIPKVKRITLMWMQNLKSRVSPKREMYGISADTPLSAVTAQNPKYTSVCLVIQRSIWFVPMPRTLLIFRTNPEGLPMTTLTTRRLTSDNLDDKAAYEFLMKAFTNFKNAMAKDASIYEFYATMKTRVFYDAFEDAGFKVGAGLIWKKPRAPFMRTDWKFNMEPIIWGWRKDGKHIWYGDQKQTAVFEFDGIKDSEKEGFSHPSSKPVPLIVYLIKQCTQTNGLVLDGFLGSATTLIACEQINRTCYGIELEPKFVDVAVVRYLQYKNNDSSDVYVIRDGQRIDYTDVMKNIDGGTENERNNDA